MRSCQLNGVRKMQVLCAFPGRENAAESGCASPSSPRCLLVEGFEMRFFKQKAIKLFSQPASLEWDCSPGAPPLLQHLKHECGRECVFKRTVGPNGPLSKLNNFGSEFICFQPEFPLDFGVGFFSSLVPPSQPAPQSRAFNLILLDHTNYFWHLRPDMMS